MDAETRMRLLEQDMDHADVRLDEIKKAIGKLTATAAMLLVSVVLSTVSILLTQAVTR
jgi:hypothetical protein